MNILVNIICTLILLTLPFGLQMIGGSDIVLKEYELIVYILITAGVMYETCQLANKRRTKHGKVYLTVLAASGLTVLFFTWNNLLRYHVNYNTYSSLQWSFKDIILKDLQYSIGIAEFRYIGLFIGFSIVSFLIQFCISEKGKEMIRLKFWKLRMKILTHHVLIYDRPPHKLTIIDAPSGAGKTRFVETLMDEAQDKLCVLPGQEFSDIVNEFMRNQYLGFKDMPIESILANQIFGSKEIIVIEDIDWIPDGEMFQELLAKILTEAISKDKFVVITGRFIDVSIPAFYVALTGLCDDCSEMIV